MPPEGTLLLQSMRLSCFGRANDAKPRSQAITAGNTYKYYYTSLYSTKSLSDPMKVYC